MGLLPLRRAAASHRLRCDVGETIWWGEREMRSTEIHHFSTSNLFTWSSPSCVLVLQLPHTDNASTIHYKGCICKKHLSILLAKQSLRASKMATRNTSSSDALLGLRPAYVACDWSPVATPALLLVDFCCLSRTLVWLFPGELPKWLDCQEKLKEQITFF